MAAPIGGLERASVESSPIIEEDQPPPHLLDTAPRSAGEAP